MLGIPLPLFIILPREYTDRPLDLILIVALYVCMRCSCRGERVLVSMMLACIFKCRGNKEQARWPHEVHSSLQLVEDCLMTTTLPAAAAAITIL